MKQSRSVKIGIVGGGIRGGMFARALQENPDAEVVAICDRSPAVLDSMAAQFGLPGYAEVSDMLADHPQLDAAVIATPDFAHREVAVACAQAGLDVMVEKPLATDVADATAIIAAAEASGSRVMVGFENRWNVKFSSVRERLHGSGSRVTAQVISLNDTAYVPTRMLAWAAKSSPAWFLMPHTLDLACWMTGVAPVSVYAVGSREVLAASGIDTWDGIAAIFTMDDGSHVSLNSSWILPTSMPAVYDFRYEIQSTTDVVRIDGANHGVVDYGPEGMSWPQTAVYERDGRIRGVPIDMVNDFVRYVRGGDVAVPGPQEGLMITTAIAAVHTSLATGQVVEICR